MSDTRQSQTNITQIITFINRISDSDSVAIRGEIDTSSQTFYSMKCMRNESFVLLREGNSNPRPLSYEPNALPTALPRDSPCKYIAFFYKKADLMKKIMLSFVLSTF